MTITTILDIIIFVLDKIKYILNIITSIFNYN